MVKVKVFLEETEEEKEIEFEGKTVADLLKFLNIESSRVVVVRNNEVITEDEEIKDGDYIKILDVVSGG